MTRIRRYTILLFVWLRSFDLKLGTPSTTRSTFMSEEAAAALDGVEDQVSAEAVEQEQAQQEPQQGAEEASEEAGDGSAEAGQDADGV